MDSPFVSPLSILAWPEVGKLQHSLPCQELSDLGRPDALGAHWPRMETPNAAFDFFAAHECDALMDRASSTLAGGIGSRADDEGAWLYYFLLPAWRGRRLGGAALALAIKRAQELWPNQPILARCTESNAHSMRLLLAAGFQHDASRPRQEEALVLRLS